VGVNVAIGDWRSWSWDKSLFAGAAEYYEQGRLPYAPGLADVLARQLGLDGRGRLLDVGCGPGIVAGFLAAETVTVPDGRAVERTADDVVAFGFSLSSTAPHLDLASPSGRFSVRLPDNVLRIWRLPG
jgi:hypothetical protein